MKLEEIFLFDGVDEYDKGRMITCFDIQKQKFEAGQTVWDCDFSHDKIGIVLSGNVSLVRVDSAGNRVVLENLSENDIFGEMFAFSDEIIRVGKNRKFGCVDGTGREFIPCIYDEISLSSFIISSLLSTSL